MPPQILCEAEHGLVLSYNDMIARCMVPRCYVCGYFIRKYKSSEVKKTT